MNTPRTVPVYPMPRWLMTMIVLSVALACLFFATGCVTAADTQAAADAQRTLEQQIAAAQQDQAAGVPPEQVQAAIKQALDDYAAQMKTIGQDVSARTVTFWDMLKGDPLGTGLGMVLSQLPLLFGLNARRNQTRAKALGKN